MHVGEERRAADGVGEEGEERDVSWGAFFFVVTVGDGRGGRCASCSVGRKRRQMPRAGGKMQGRNERRGSDGSRTPNTHPPTYPSLFLSSPLTAVPPTSIFQAVRRTHHHPRKTSITL